MPQRATTETKVFTLTEAKMTGDSSGPGRLSGYASIKGNVDSYGDQIMDGAYTNLEMMVKDGWSGFNHSSNPIGYFIEAREDAKGLFVEIEFHSTSDAQDIRTKAQERINAGKSVGMSIMFKTLEFSRVQREEEEVRELHKIEIVEAGFVMMPANKSALVTNVKSATGGSLGEKYDAARESAEDLHQSLSDLNEETKGQLTKGRKDMIAEMARKWAELNDLVTKSEEDEPPVMATPDEVASLQAALADTGVLN